jgi:hypothetical protein
MRMPPRFFAVASSLLLLAATVPALTWAAAGPTSASVALVDDPTVMGQWSNVIAWPDKAVHSILLHTGKVLWYRGEGGSAPTSYTWDPTTNTLESQLIGAGVFCSGHSVLPDGRVLDTGGRIGTSGSLGPSYTVIFDPITQLWSRGPDMHKGRYYPTQVVLGSGRTLVFSGYDDTHTINETVESFYPGTGPGGTDQWEILPNADHFMPYYPRFHLLPSGLVIHVSKDPLAETFDPATGAWTPVATSHYGSRAEGTSVLLPPGFQKIMIMGGGSNTNTCEILDLSAPTPAWSFAAPMKYGRSHLNNVILPDATVLVAGGSGSGYVYPAELYDPATNTWREMASMHTYREYHSSALLLPDGRCLWAGTDGNHTAEVYSPPYLFRGTRPVIDSCATSVGYGESFRILATDASTIGSVVFMRPGATTHSQNMEQRYVPLPFTRTADGQFLIDAPTNPNTAPPGYYMVFVLDGNKIPSVARFVRLGGTAGPVSNRPPSVFAGPDLTVDLPASASLEGRVDDDGLPSPPALTQVWRKVNGPGSVTFGDSLAARTTASFSAPGTYELSLTGSDGALTQTDVVTIVARAPGACTGILDRQVASGADDAEEKSSGSVSLTSSDIELVFDGGLQTAGLRFTGINIPQGVVITSAYIQFTVDEAQSEATALTLYGQDADEAGVFTTASRNLSSRPRTDAFVTWSPSAWTTVGTAGPAQRTPDLSAVIQEIVDRPTWLARSLAFVITGTGHRTARAFESSPTLAAKLHIEIACEGGNRRPKVDAGPDQTITLPASAILENEVTDDGRPDPPAEVIKTWSKVSGPQGGEVTFEDVLAVVKGGHRTQHDSGTKKATFTKAGTYVLRLTADDHELTASDDVTVVVHREGGDPVVLERPVAAGADDAEEKSSGSVSLTSSDLELVFDGAAQTLGLRFTGVTIPRGAEITNAYVQFTVDEAQSEATSLTIRGQDADDTAVFTTASRNVSSRPPTDALASWSPLAWSAIGTAGLDQRTPDLTSVIQEIVDRPGWAGRSLAVLITGTGHRTADSFEGAHPPLLHVEYLATSPNIGPPIQQAPAPAIVATRLGAVFPNPGPGSVTVRFDLARESEVLLEVYDVRGALVQRIVSGRRTAGSYSESWDGRDRNGRRLVNGVYLVHFAADRHRETRKLVVLPGASRPGR